jgi:hypothetical protein
VIILHTLGVQGLRRALILLSFLLPVSLLFLSCGSSSTSSGGGGSGLTFRAFVSQDVTGGGAVAGVQIVNAELDVLAPAAAISAGATPRIMVETPNLASTLVVSPSDKALTIISNSGESASSRLALPGPTDSVVVSPNSVTAYAAVPTATVVGQSPGAVELVNLNGGAITAEISCPSGNPNPPVCVSLPPVPAGLNLPYHYLTISNSGSRLLAFSDNSDVVAVITPSNLGTASPVITFVPGFDRPVTAFFSGDDNTAFVVNCGAECGGTQAGVQKLDLTTNTLGTVVGACTTDVAPVCAGRGALLDGTTLYLAGIPFNADGTPFSQPCTGETTAATSCGLLTVIDLTSMAVTKSGIVITDGIHDRMALGANGQLFIGGHTCTEIIPPIPPPQGAEVRGCLSIYNTQTEAVVIPPANGDVTGIQPISKRNVVYVVQGGELQIYDTTTDQLQTTQVNIIGEAIDVKLVDF